MESELSLRALEEEPGFSLAECLNSGFKVTLIDNADRLLQNENEVIWVKGQTIVKRIVILESTIINALFTSFNDTNTTNYVERKASNRALVVLQPEEARVYYSNGDNYFCSFPFRLQNGFPFQNGLVLEKEHSEEEGQLNFMTMLDPVLELGAVGSSSTSSISPREKLLWFPTTSKYSLAVTFNQSESTLEIYHVRYLTRHSPQNARHSVRRKVSAGIRKHSGISTPNSSRLVDEADISTSTAIFKNRNASHSDMMSIDRMASISESIPDSIKPHPSIFEAASLRKDVIFAKVESIRLEKEPHRAYSITYQDEEAVVVVGKESTQVLIFASHPARSPVFKRSLLLQCLDCVEVGGLNETIGGMIAVLKSPRKLVLLNPFLDLVTPSVDFKNTTLFHTIASVYSDKVALVSSEGKTFLFQLMILPENNLVARLLELLKYLYGNHVYHSFWLHWVCALGLCGNEWDAFVVAVMALFVPEGTTSRTVYTGNPVTQLFPMAQILKAHLAESYHLEETVSRLVVCIHLVREDLKLDISQYGELDRMGVFLAQLCVWLGWPEAWVNYYAQENMDHFLIGSSAILVKPPNLLESLASAFTDTIVPYVTLSQVCEESDEVDEKITWRSCGVLRLFETLISSQYSDVDVLNTMVENCITQHFLNTLPSGVFFPLKNCLIACEKKAQVSWREECLLLVGRNDLLNMKRRHFTEDKPLKTPSLQKEVHSILESLEMHEADTSETHLSITKLIFDEDRRFYEVSKLLQTSKTQTASLMPGSVSEHQLYKLHRGLAAMVAMRTLTIPLGRAALFVNSCRPLMTERFPIPHVNLNTLIVPSMTNVSLEKEVMDQSITQWGFFHNGVSSGLSISRDAEDISGSWVVFNKPSQLTSEHAGFLLGIGLNGHLSSLEEWHIYNYLGPKHLHTSVALLLGMSASLRGTMNLKMTKVLSVHVVALLPHGSSDLNVALPVQTAGLVGIGLLFCESQHRRMSEVLLSQLKTSQHEPLHDEGYKLGAGIGLGYINLGKAHCMKDSKIPDKLVSLAVNGSSKSQGGALLALAMIFMKSHESGMAQSLKLPDSAHLLEYIRPISVFLRTLCYNVVMWDDIDPSSDWLFSQVPACISSQLESISVLDSDQQGFFHVVGGAALSIGLKFSSSNNGEAKSTLLAGLDEMIRITHISPKTHDEKLAHNGASVVRDIFMLSLSLVMAGSGDLETFRRLRALYGNTENSPNYGGYMCANLAMGFLFLGSGLYAFSDSNFALASLIVSLYPIFPSHNTECNEVHLQALRHFWALSVEPRCIVPRDIETQKPCKVAISVTLKDYSHLQMEAPCLLPNLDSILAISTLQSEYLPVFVEVDDVFKKSLQMYVSSKHKYEDLKKHSQAILNSFSSTDPWRPLNDLSIFSQLDSYEKTVLGKEELSALDFKLELSSQVYSPTSLEDLWNLKLVFNYTDRCLKYGGLRFLNHNLVENLKSAVWSMSN